MEEDRVADAKKVLLVYMTCPDAAVARSLGRELVERRLAAGVNIVPSALSIYRWRGETREKEECALFAQISEDALNELLAAVRASHPYVVPCALALPVSGGLPDFLRWIEDNSGTG